MKYWLLTLLVISVCAGTLTWIIQKKVIPGFLAHANEEMVADWHAGLTGYRKETGSWPDFADPVKFSDQIYIVLGADGRRIHGGYMSNRPNEYTDGVFYDKYHQPMRVTLEGENLLIASAGPNRTWGDADDVTSDNVQERYTPGTLAQARAQAQEAAEARAKKSP